jgi:transposase
MAAWPTWAESRRRRDKAIELRRQGMSYKQIRAAIGGSMASLSKWLRDVPLSDLQRAGLKRRRREAALKTARANHERRLAREAEIKLTTATDIGSVTERDLFIAGVVAYAAEGAKKKPWQTSRSVMFTNSDPRMIVLFLRWLSLVGIDRSSLSFRVSIHVDAEVEESVRFWADVVGVPPDAFKRTTLKRGNPKTQRRNIGPDYRGCLNVGVCKSCDLNKQLDGWFDALVNRAESRSMGTGHVTAQAAGNWDTEIRARFRGGLTA